MIFDGSILARFNCFLKPLHRIQAQSGAYVLLPAGRATQKVF
jgi:hypothetical protein